MKNLLKTVTILSLCAFASLSEAKAQGVPPCAPAGYIYVWRYDYFVDPWTGRWSWQYHWALVPRALRSEW
jgi:hypothetical protein